jgi:riboflavin kinase/FMN adenylyltransferase
LNIYRQLADLPAPTTPVVATIGNYDGVHLGHQGVIAEVIARARALGGQSLAITFEPHPARVLHPERPHLFLTPLARRLELLAATGIDATLVLPFTDELRRSSARDFATSVLAGTLRVTEIHEGANFRFGHQAEAGVTGPYGLQALGRELGFSVIIHPPLSLRGGTVSSSRIRALIAHGNVSQARVLLGRPFSVDSTPASGRGFGTRFAVPTINLAPYPELLPAHGVYVTTLAIGSGPAAETFHAVTNVGIRPTFGAASFTVESHLLDFHPIPLTQQTPLRLTFLLRLRPEQRFADVETLRAQIARDVTRARRFFALCKSLS